MTQYQKIVLIYYVFFGVKMDEKYVQKRMQENPASYPKRILLASVYS